MLILKRLAAVLVVLIIPFFGGMTVAQPKREFVPLDDPPGDPTPIGGTEYLLTVGAILGGCSIYYVSRKKKQTKTQWQQPRL